jgi:hypothetical protein
MRFLGAYPTEEELVTDILLQIQVLNSYFGVVCGGESGDCGGREYSTFLRLHIHTRATRTKVH